MKNVIILTLLILSAASVSAQTMRDSTVTIPIIARACVIAVSYQGTVVRDTLTPDQVAAWVAARGVSSSDSTAPIQAGLISYLRAEIGRHHGAWVSRRDLELGLVDADDSQTLAQIRAARTAIRTRYRQWQYHYTVKVPALTP